MLNWNWLLTEEEEMVLEVVDIFFLNVENMLYYDPAMGIYYCMMSTLVGFDTASFGLLVFMSLDYVKNTYLNE